MEATLPILFQKSGTLQESCRLSIKRRHKNSKTLYHNDHLGGVNVITDIWAARVQLTEYDPWGKVSREEGTVDPNRRFTGHIFDPESGLYYYGCRYYDPELGRFISPDPFIGQPGDPQNHNRYSYVINNPVNGIDPSGYFQQVKKQKKKGGFFRSVFGRILTATVFAVATYGAFTWTTGVAFSGTTAAVTGAAAASATGVMEIPPIKRFLARAGPVAGFFASLGLNMGFQLTYGALASPTLVEAREFNYAQAGLRPIDWRENLRIRVGEIGSNSGLRFT